MFHWRISDRQSFWDSIGHNNLHVYSDDWTANIRDGWNDQRFLGNDARQIYLWHWRGVFSGRSFNFRSKNCSLTADLFILGGTKQLRRVVVQRQRVEHGFWTAIVLCPCRKYRQLFGYGTNL